MQKIIASTYEVLQEIGSGGGGIVYLARHLRLDKLVVLKADKKMLSAKPEAHRREVDALKNLSHTYIPQVYDFFAENGVVYTVMDYIEGESLDKPLKRGERFEQAKVIEWACELLEAVDYLHTRPPYGILHSDIKPSNIMLTPQGEIRLIDFNIALALGEEGAVQVGRSLGYASPEHYSMEYSDGVQADAATVLMTEDADKTVVMGKTSGYGTGSSGNSILLDARSDIYSVGATLYHLLSGRRPKKFSDGVIPLTEEEANPAVIAIIEKAMATNPDERYQTAEEMLYDLEHLHENDSRTKRYKKLVSVTAVVLAATFLSGGLCTFAGLKQMEQAEKETRVIAETAEEEARAAEEAAKSAEEEERLEKQALELATASQKAYQNGDVQSAINLAAEAISLGTSYSSLAQKALTDALGVYDLTDGYKAYSAIELPSEPLKAILSPNGVYAAAMTLGKLSVFDTAGGELIAELPAEPSALSNMVFAEENVIIYAGAGGVRAYDLAEGKELWSGNAATAISISEDGLTVATLYKDESCAYVYDAVTGDIIKTVDFMGKHQDIAANDVFADPGDNLFTLSGDGRWLAVNFSDGALWIFDLWDNENDIELYDVSEYTHFEGGFSGNYFALASAGVNDSVFAVINLTKMTQTGAFYGTVPYHTYADSTGIYVAAENVLVKLDPETGEQTETAYTSADITAFKIGDKYTLVVTSDGNVSFFDKAANLLENHEENERCDFAVFAGAYALTASLDSPVLHLMKLESHEEAQMFTYDISYTHSEARISSDLQTVMLFSYNSFRLYSINGELITEVLIPDAAQVYDQQYRRSEDVCSLDVIYNDGFVRSYSAYDGSILSETQGEKPDETLYEEFFTADYKIESPLHGTPAVYKRSSGELVKELESDAYLTYVTQVEDNIITEYVTVQGVRYGLLLDADCETLAELPNLCDILPDGTLIFDDMRGNLRSTRIYSIQELLSLVKN